MKIHKNNATHRGVSKRSTYFLLYTAAFLICSACIYVWFARTGRSLISTAMGGNSTSPRLFILASMAVLYCEHC